MPIRPSKPRKNVPEQGSNQLPSNHPSKLNLICWEDHCLPCAASMLQMRANFAKKSLRIQLEISIATTGFILKSGLRSLTSRLCNPRLLGSIYLLLNDLSIYNSNRRRTILIRNQPCRHKTALNFRYSHHYYLFANPPSIRIIPLSYVVV